MRTVAIFLSATLVWCSAPASSWASDHVPFRDWITIHAGDAFSFEAPPGTTAVPVRGIDSFVGRYKSDHFGLDFDYGEYSNTLTDEQNDKRFATEKTTIDGKPAVIVTGPGSDGCKFLTDVNVRVSQYLSLTMLGCSADQVGVDELHRLFRSLKLTGAPAIRFGAPSPAPHS